MSIDTKIDTKPSARLPAELVASSLFLLKRLGFAAKSRSIEMYEREGLNPYHYAILALLDEGAARDAGRDRGLARLRPRHARRPARRARGEAARRAQARSGRPAPAPRPPHRRRQAHARPAPHAAASASRTSSSHRSTPSSAKQLHALLLELAERHEPRCAPLT